LPKIEGCTAKVFLAVPYTSISAAARAAKGSEVWVGAQNMHDAGEGAFTGEIAALMLKEAGASFVLLGHSERRSIFKETNEFICRKVTRALKDDLIPVLCVGETEKERKAKKTKEVLCRQIEECLEGIPKEEIGKLILAYEPVWAIGTGQVATGKIIQEAHEICKEALMDLFGKRKGALIPVLYGGSVKPENAKEILAEDLVDGLLVGGASLNVDSFAKIILPHGEKPSSKRKKS
jgi:triosephosphate isomerase